MTGLLGATSPSPLWYLTRGSGLVALLLLTGTVVLGILGSLRFSTPAWPRFVQQGLHRNLSLLTVILVPIHVITSVADGFVPLTIFDAFVPFNAKYRPIWVGLGAIAFDLLIALVITSLLRHKIGQPSWRFVHWLAYLCWPIALIHGIGTGSDATDALVVLIDGICVVAVLISLGWRLYSGWPRNAALRTTAALGAVVATLGIVIFSVVGPFSPNWAKRAGSKVNAVVVSSNKSPTSTTTTSPSNSTLISTPFSANFTGTVSTSQQNSQGYVTVSIKGSLSLAGSPILSLSITGIPSESGVEMVSSSVTLGSYKGIITNLSGTQVIAKLTGSNGNKIQMTSNFQLQQNSSQASGTVSGVSVSR
ncbi:MAG: hypothetical protein HKL80_02195 [Acidimicrobiales bacterium]|nr:hypothetical protein [Acidimicrobiales bacterium]